jgi:hypothetical protein
MLLGIIYVISSVYCLWRMLKRYNKSSLDGIIGISPAFDTFVIIMFAPLLMVVDLIITWIQWKKD